MSAMSLVGAAAFLAAALPFSPPATEQPPTAQATKARHEVCYMLAAAGSYPALNLADCLGFDTAPDAVFRTQVCGFLREADQLRDYYFSSYSDCLQRGVTR
jgi:hypothetical protein